MQDYLNLQHIYDIDKYLKKVDDTLIFQGNTLRIYIPVRFEERGMLTIENKVLSTVGIMHLIVDEKYHTVLNLIGIVKVGYNEFTIIEIEGMKYYEVIRNKGDVFLHNTSILQNNNLPYLVYLEMDSLGKVPYFYEYMNYADRFMYAKETSGVNLDQDKAVYELSAAYLARDPSNLSVQYRHADMKKHKKPTIISTREIALSSESSLAKISGSYFKDGLDGALRSDNKGSYHTENILRS